jgi:2',3'-cyclic-nucleotide 2'-phosphodiesterase (5'-nucleotidase family)
LIAAGCAVGLPACSVARKDAGSGPPPASGTSERLAAAPPASLPTAVPVPVRALEILVEEGPVKPLVAARGICDPAERTHGKARITLAHLNDLQARYHERLAGKSRYAYIAGWLQKLRRDVPQTLVLDAGDDYEKGAVAELRSMGETTRQMVQALPIDVRTIGNHDFAYGEEQVLRDARLSGHPVLAANVVHARLPAAEQPFAPFARFDVGCVRVGVIGLVTQSYGADDRQTKEPYLGVFQHDDRYAHVLGREIAAHRDEVDVLVALTHLGFYEDTLTVTRAGKGVDLVVGAHTEDLLEQPLVVNHQGGGRTWVLQAGHFGETLGRADLVVDLATKSVTIERYKIVSVDASLPVDDDVARLAERLEADTLPDAQKAVGVLRAPVARGNEMAELVAHVVREQGADAVVLGRDLFWDGLPKGPVTLQRLYDAVLVQRQPAGTSGFSSLWAVDVTGAELARLRDRFRPGWAYIGTWPARTSPDRRYRLVLDKRALVVPKVAFAEGTRLPAAAPLGEMIDVLERWARARTERGETID